MGAFRANEPMATQTWESCIYTAEEEADFIETALGPVLKKNGWLQKLIIWDHNRLDLPAGQHYPERSEVAKYVWGNWLSLV